MSQIQAKIIADSMNPAGAESRLTTFQLVYPRFVHAEFMTHRVFSRNASSSRAIPVAKMIEQVRNNPAMPIHWGKNQPGMQAREELTGDVLREAQAAWIRAANHAADIAEWMNKLEAHKQVVNRILEPFQLIHVVATATETDNFFELRDHEDAEPNIQALARAMRAAMNESTPIKRYAVKDADADSWHLPYITDEERNLYRLDVLRKCSVARCARVSYLKHDGTSPSVAEDVALYERLVGSRPLHASPTEHQARPLHSASEWSKEWSKNFRGWHQFRADVEARMSKF